MVSSEKKWEISAMSAFVFFIIASPQLYKFTGKLFKITDPTMHLLMHAVVYMLVTRMMMGQ